MDYVLSYDSYKEENGFHKPIFLWNESTKCLKVNNYYLFVEKELMIEEGDERLNEEFGFSDLLPQTASDWTHLGVDGVSAIVSAFGGKFVGIGLIIDIIHSVSYFVEAKVKPAGEAFGLTMCGIVTAIFAPIPAFGAESVGSAVIKRFLSTISKLTGGFFKSFFKYGSKILGVDLFKRAFKFLFNLQPVRKVFLDIILKYEDKWIFKMFMKIPGIKQIINFIKTDLSVVLKNAEAYLAKDFIIYKKAVALECERIFASKMKSLDPVVARMITDDQLKRLGKSLATKELDKITPELISKNSDLIANVIKNNGETFAEKICNISIKQVNTDLKIINSELQKVLLSNKITNVGVIKLIEKEAVEHYIAKGTVKAIPYETIISKAMRKLPVELLKKVPVALLKRFGVVATKNAILHSEIGNSSDASKEGQAKAEVSVKSDPELKPEPDTENDFAKENGLTVSEVATSAEIGNLNIQFRTPEKDGEDGKLFLQGDVFSEYDLTPSMNLYPSSESLLDDLKFVGKKDDDKTRLRGSVYKKWEKSGIRTTPWITNLNCRYEFYFLIRERSEISLYQKNHQETVNFDFLDGDQQEYQKLNSSLFLIVKKVERNG